MSKNSFHFYLGPSLRSLPWILLKFLIYSFFQKFFQRFFEKILPGFIEKFFKVSFGNGSYEKRQENPLKLLSDNLTGIPLEFLQVFLQKNFKIFFRLISPRTFLEIPPRILLQKSFFRYFFFENPSKCFSFLDIPLERLSENFPGIHSFK